ncbi:hypothetical protein BGX34_007021, partial [Mortierella sp. NVP85]
MEAFKTLLNERPPRDLTLKNLLEKLKSIYEPHEPKMRIQDLGSDDLSSLLKFREELKLSYRAQSLSMHPMPSDQENVVVYTHHISKLMDLLLISRLLILGYLLNFGCSSFTAERWMLMQVCPYVFGIEDVFNTIFNYMVGQTNMLDSWSLTTALRDLFTRIKTILGTQGKYIGRQAKFMMVLDEAQALREIGFGDYQSTQGEGMRPVLSPFYMDSDVYP